MSSSLSSCLNSSSSNQESTDVIPTSNHNVCVRVSLVRTDLSLIRDVARLLEWVKEEEDKQH